MAVPARSEALQCFDLTTSGLPVLWGSEKLQVVAERVTVDLSSTASPSDSRLEGTTVYVTSQRLLLKPQHQQQLFGTDLSDVTFIKASKSGSFLLCGACGRTSSALVRVGKGTLLRFHWAADPSSVASFLNNLRSAVELHKNAKLRQQGTLRCKDIAGNDFEARPAGVAGVRAAEQRLRDERKQLLNRAFTDMNHLSVDAENLRAMSEALVRESQRMRHEALSQDPEALLSVMLRDMMRFAEDRVRIAAEPSERSKSSEYCSHLARDLYDFLEPIVAKNGGLLHIFDAYVLYNSTRPVTDIVPADDLCDACAQWPILGLRLRLEMMESQLVIRTTETVPVSQRLLERIKEVGFMTSLQVADQFHIPVQVAAWQLESAEREGFLCRDEEETGCVRYFLNEFDAIYAAEIGRETPATGTAGNELLPTPQTSANEHILETARAFTPPIFPNTANIKSDAMSVETLRRRRSAQPDQDTPKSLSEWDATPQ
jgi:hypothetical protein